MKRIIPTVLCVIMLLFAMTACGNGKKDSNTVSDLVSDITSDASNIIDETSSMLDSHGNISSEH